MPLAEARAASVRAIQAGQPAVALDLIGRILQARPDDAQALANLGVLFRRQGRADLARIAQRRAVEADPGSRIARGNLANALADIGETEEALALRRALLDEQPGDPALTAMIGKCLRSLRRFDEGIDWLRQGVDRFPDDAEMRIQLALTLLAAGRYAEGFRLWSARWETGELAPRPMPVPAWDGATSLDGKRLLVVPEQGFGDTIAFARMLPRARALGAREVTLLVKPPLARALSRVEGADRVVTEEPPAGDYDTWCYLMDLCAPQFEADPAAPPPTRIHVPQDSRDRARALARPAADRMRVGLVWAGSVTYRGDRFRSFPHSAYWPLLDLPGTRFYSLYQGPRVAEFEADGTAALIHDVARTERDFADNAAMMQELDLVVTTCTVTAHLAGSLGVPTWILLHWDSFWMWGATGDRSPWYPSARLFRQDRPRDWDGVIARVRDGIAAETARRGRAG
ncbi:tetratricopeptide repeat protein [Wenxinia saemankumensis]|nr:tetratricopeptide repeat protein [Wenxinia saemankumensis]